MREKYYLASFIEDNDLGVYPKDLLVKSTNFKQCFDEMYNKYPTLFGLKEIHGRIDENYKFYYSHEGQDQLRTSQLELRNIEINK